MKYDIIVIGAGPAGLSASLNAKILQRKVLLVGDSLGSKKTWSAPKVLNYLGLPEISGQALNDAFVNHFKSMQVEFLQKRVHGVYDTGNQFMVDADGDFLTADSVILSCGVSALPSVNGEEDFLGKGVSYCATCDAPLLKDKTACVLGYDQESIAETNYIAGICKKVYFVPMTKYDEKQLAPSVEVVVARPVAFEGTDGKATTLVTDKGNIDADGFFVLKQLSASNLVAGLAVENNHVIADKQGKTNIDGLFACGDVVGKPYKYAKSVGEGLVAAFSADQYLTNKGKPTADGQEK